MQIKTFFSLSLSVFLSQILLSCGSNTIADGTQTNNTPSNNNNPASQETHIEQIAFTPLQLSADDNNSAIKSMRVSPQLTVTYPNNVTKTFPLVYKTLINSGDKLGNTTFGQVETKNSTPISNPDGSSYISNDPDGNSLLSVAGRHYLLSNMEALPGSIYRTELKLENNTLKATATQSIDVSSLQGTLINCASSKTNYGSHLGGEENFALNTRYVDENSTFYIDCSLEANKKQPTCVYQSAMTSYLGNPTSNYSPYHYGHIVEVAPQADGSNKVAKHYVTGRFTPELALMMPDNKTLYMSDDGNYKGLWKFVSDTKIDAFTQEWEGTLYAVKLTQKSAKDGGDFTLSWIELAHAKDSEIKDFIKKKNPTLSSFFTLKKPDVTSGQCTLGFTKITEDAQVECLKLNKINEKEAAFLESRKYAAYKGATMEFNKAEGLAYNPDKKELYLAITSIDKSMLKETNSTTDDIALPQNKCGAVYALQLDQSYNASSLKAIITGEALAATSPYANNYACNPEKIANPDNIKFLGHQTLLIGEDTPYHMNNMIWAYHTTSKTLTRIASLPIGAEVTGMDKGTIGTKAVLTVNIQHPLRDNPKAVDTTKVHSTLLDDASKEEKKGVVGYIDGLPLDMFK